MFPKIEKIDLAFANSIKFRHRFVKIKDYSGKMKKLLKQKFSQPPSGGGMNEY